MQPTSNLGLIKSLAFCVFAISLYTSPPRANETDGTVRPTKGEYLGHEWRIDPNHLIWWDGKPYVRYGFTGNGEIGHFIKLGFDQFNAYPSEELWVFSKDPTKNAQAIREIEEFTDELVKRGATYFAGLNLLWPWQGSEKIAPDDMVHCALRKVWDVTEFAGTTKPLEFSFVTDRPLRLNRQAAKILLFDMTGRRHEDITPALKSIRTTRQRVTESPGEAYTATRHCLVLGRLRLPVSEDLRLTLLSKTSVEMVPGVYPSSFPALWKPGIIRHYREGLRSSRRAYAKEGLRGMMFGDEINTDKISLLHSEIYIDFRDDEIALESYRLWLRKKFETLSQLNEYLNSDFQDFGQVKWQVPLYPFLEKDCDDREFPPGNASDAFGLPDSREQIEKFDQLQDQFRVWFYGHWLARYANMAKDIIGNVPVFITSAGIGGSAEFYLQIHKNAMAEGMDGLIRNHYAWVKRTSGGRLDTFVPGSQERFPLETVTELLDSVQKQSGMAKAYFANEFGRPRTGGDDFVDDFGLGYQFSFRSKQELRDFLTVLIENGYKGFNMFKMNPSVEAARQEVKWFSELKEEMVKKTVGTTAYRKEARITAEKAISIAREHPRIEKILRKHRQARASVTFSKRYNVWIVEFVEDDREVGFATVSNEGRVLEVAGNDPTEVR